MSGFVRSSSLLGIKVRSYHHSLLTIHIRRSSFSNVYSITYRSWISVFSTKKLDSFFANKFILVGVTVAIIKQYNSSIRSSNFSAMFSSLPIVGLSWQPFHGWSVSTSSINPLPNSFFFSVSVSDPNVSPDCFQNTFVLHVPVTRQLIEYRMIIVTHTRVFSNGLKRL